MMKEVLLIWTALAAGFATAGGFVAFISLIGVVPRLAAITKTADHIPLYENSLALGLIVMNILYMDATDHTADPAPYGRALYRDLCGMPGGGAGGGH